MQRKEEMNQPIKATLCIGWRQVLHHGGYARLRTMNFLKETFWPNFEYISIQADDESLADRPPFNRSWAKNNAAARAKRLDGGDPDRVLVFTDADVYAPPHQVRFAVEAVNAGADLCLAHNGTALYMNEGFLRGNGLGGIVGPFPGGIFAIRRSVFEAMGGWDERFVGWGHEDLCFLNSADKIFGFKIMMSNDEAIGPFYKLDMGYPRLTHEGELMNPEGRLAQDERDLYLRNSARRDAYFGLEPGDKLGYWELRHREIADEPAFTEEKVDG